MKFNLVPIGEQFTYQGIIYTKSGPISASAELDGKSRMIPRSANVKTSNNIELVESSVREEISSAEVLSRVNSYHAESLEIFGLTKNDLSQEMFEEITTKLNNAHQELINSL